MKTITIMLIPVAGIYTWAEFKRIDDKTYSIPLYVCEVLHGPHLGESIAACQYYDIKRNI